MVALSHLGLGATLAASTVLGTSVRMGRLDLGRRHWIHHALYGATMASAVVATISGRAERSRTWRVAGSTLGVLALLPATTGGSKAHMTVAAAASAVYVAGTIAVTSLTQGGD